MPKGRAPPVQKKFFHGSFVKVEEAGFRPLFKVFPQGCPILHLDEARVLGHNASPFERQPHTVIASHFERQKPRNPSKPRPAFCEVCGTFSRQVRQHLHSEEHMNAVHHFNYTSFDDILSNITGVLPKLIKDRARKRILGFV